MTNACVPPQTAYQFCTHRHAPHPHNHSRHTTSEFFIYTIYSLMYLSRHLPTLHTTHTPPPHTPWSHTSPPHTSHHPHTTLHTIHTTSPHFTPLIHHLTPHMHQLSPHTPLTWSNRGSDRHTTVCELRGDTRPFRSNIRCERPCTNRHGTRCERRNTACGRTLHVGVH